MFSFKSHSNSQQGQSWIVVGWSWDGVGSQTGLLIRMRKTELDLLGNIAAATPTNPLLVLPTRTPQHRFLLTYAALHFLRNNQPFPATSQLLHEGEGSFSSLQLSLRYMKDCMERRQQLEDPRFRVLSLLVLWMENLEKLKSSKEPKLLAGVLLPHPQRLPLHHYEELLVYLGYIGKDLQLLLKGGKIGAEEQLSLLALLLPRSHFNIVLPADVLGREGSQQTDVLFCNDSLIYQARTKQYRMLAKATLQQLLSLTLTLTQHRELLDRACRYYLLFWGDRRMSAEQLFLAVFAKTPEAVRFSLSDELVLFFRVAAKLGGGNVERAVREKWTTGGELLDRFVGAVVGQPKDEVNPFNSLGLRETVSVGAGKCVERVIEIFHEYSLFYFWMGVENHDVNLRLSYLGDFESKVEVRKLLLSEDKLNAESRSAFMATRRGLYLLEMDNSFSWINAKHIKLEVVVLSPHMHAPSPNWLSHLFELDEEDRNEEQRGEELKDEKEENREEKKEEKKKQEDRQEELKDKQLEQEVKQIQEVKEEEKIDGDKEAIIEKQKQTAVEIVLIEEQPLKQIEKQSQSQQLQLPINPKSGNAQQILLPDKVQSEQKIPAPLELNVEKQSSTSSIDAERDETSGQANLSLIDGIFSLLVSYTDHTYEFETNLEDRIVKRLQAYSQQRLTWIVNGEARDWLRKQKLKLARHTP